MGVDQRTGPGTNPRIPLVVSKSDSSHGTATTAHRTLGLMPAGTICRSNLSLSHYPLHVRITLFYVSLAPIISTFTPKSSQAVFNVGVFGECTPSIKLGTHNAHTTQLPVIMHTLMRPNQIHVDTFLSFGNKLN